MLSSPNYGFVIRLVHVILLFHAITTGCNSVNEAELKLMSKLFPKTSSSLKDVLPVIDERTPVNVKLQIALRQIMNVHEKSQVISLSVWFRQYWNNPMLKWNSSDYSHISSINVDNDLVWVPDICLYNTADDGSSLYQRLDTKLIVSSDGNCTWFAPIILKNECKINVEFFPFDEQSCKLQFGSWTYNTLGIDVHPLANHADLDSYITNGAWHIIDVRAERQQEKFPCCPGNYSYVIFTVRIRRRMLYYVCNLIIPCAVIAALAFLSFYLPVDSGERISLVITVLLAMTVYMLMVSNSMPPTSEVIPLIGKYYLAVMMEIALCLLATCITIRWHHTNTPMPRWLHSIVVRCFGKMFCTNGSEIAYLDAVRGQNCVNEVTNKTTQPGTIPQCHMVTKYSSSNNVLVQEINSAPMSDMDVIHRELEVLTKKIKDDEQEECIRHDWKKAAQIMDRIFFALFLITFLLFSVVILAAVPKYRN